MARFFVQSRLSEHQSITPEGYLLCQAVPITRTGSLEYQPDEVPVSAGGKNCVTIYRDAGDLFDPAAIASYEGKPVTIGHPDQDVNPSNWRDLAKGHVQNVRRGSGNEADLLLADILVTDEEAIELIRKRGIREISCGYDADYEEIEPGKGKQVSFIGNHVALVDAGRAGPRCAVRDTIKDSRNMAKRRSFMDFLRGNPKMQRALDEAVEEAAKDNEPPKPEDQPPATDNEPTTDNEDVLAEILLVVRAILEKINGSTGDEDPAQTDDEDSDDEDAPIEAKTGDEDEPKPATQDARRRMVDAATIAQANTLAPHLRARTGDNATAVKRAALSHAVRDTAGIGAALAPILKGRAINRLDSLSLDAAFAAASIIAKGHNNARTADALTRPVRDIGGTGKAITPTDLNALFVAHRASLEGGVK